MRQRKKKLNRSRVAIIFAALFYGAYVVVYWIVFPHTYGTRLQLSDWLFKNPDKLITLIQDPNAFLMSEGKLWAFKILLDVLWIGFTASLFYFAWGIHNRKPQYHPKAVVRDREAYLQALEINERIHMCGYHDTKGTKTAVRNVMEHLRNESAFGAGTDAVIACEQEIAQCLQTIADTIVALSDEATAEKAQTIILENCKTIQSKLKLRTELKKR